MPENRPILRVALVGLGSMGRNHMRVLSELSGIELVAVVDQRMSEFGLKSKAKFLSSVSQLEDMAIDFCVVATPTASHHLVCLQLADMGFHVLVEKPIALTIAQARQMAAEFETRGLIGGVGHVERFNPAITALREHLQANTIGAVFQIATRRQSSRPSRVTDVGVMMDLATHDFDLVPWVTSSRYTKVFCQALRAGESAVEDLLAVTARLENGIVVNHVINWVSPMKERIVVVTGERGTLVANTVTGHLTHYEQAGEPVEWDRFANFSGLTEGTVTRLPRPKKEPLVAELEGFRDAVLGLDGGYATFQEGVNVLEVVEAAEKSSAKSIAIGFGNLD